MMVLPMLALLLLRPLLLARSAPFLAHRDPTCLANPIEPGNRGGGDYQNHDTVEESESGSDTVDEDEPVPVP